MGITGCGREVFFFFFRIIYLSELTLAFHPAQPQDIIQTHFRLKRLYIQHQLDRWAELNRQSIEQNTGGRKGSVAVFGAGRYHTSGKEIEAMRPELVGLLEALKEEERKVGADGV